MMTKTRVSTPTAPRYRVAGMIVAALLALPFGPAVAEDHARSRGQRVYVPAYSHVLVGDRASRFDLAATLSIRNTDPLHAVTVTAADYYDGSGRLVKRYLAQPRVLPPLAATEVFIPESDTTGGFGASFLVSWASDTAVSAPIIECLLIGARSGQGISIRSPGRVIDGTPP
jgi:hypothetical protein